MTAPVLFVAGTDTGVGKTYVATALCRALRERGVRVAAFKPVETGCDDASAPADALALKAAAGLPIDLDEVCPYRFRAPLAPAIAARQEGRTVDLGLVEERLDSLRRKSDLVVCEGAGGLLVPLSHGVLTADWIVRQGFPVLLVARLGLGTINHTLLSVRWLRDHGVPFLGTVLSASEPVSDRAAESNPDTLSAFPEVRLLGVSRRDLPPPIPPAAVDAVAALR